jgi:hypothetical protein
VPFHGARLALPEQSMELGAPYTRATLNEVRQRTYQTCSTWNTSPLTTGSRYSGSSVSGCALVSRGTSYGGNVAAFRCLDLFHVEQPPDTVRAPVEPPRWCICASRFNGSGIAPTLPSIVSRGTPTQGPPGPSVPSSFPPLRIVPRETPCILNLPLLDFRYLGRFAWPESSQLPTKRVA